MKQRIERWSETREEEGNFFFARSNPLALQLTTPGTTRKGKKFLLFSYIVFLFFFFFFFFYVLPFCRCVLSVSTTSSQLLTQIKTFYPRGRFLSGFVTLSVPTSIARRLAFCLCEFAPTVIAAFNNRANQNQGRSSNFLA